MLELIGQPAGTRVKVTGLDSFFQEVTQEQDWHDAEEKEEVQKFRQLVEAIKGALADVKVFQVGRVEKDVYIVGRAGSEGWAGLKTRVVET